jgi:hypothetical protein
MRNTTLIRRVSAFILVVLCITTFLYYITKKQEGAKQDSQNNIVLNENWLTNPACFPPCWNGINPGKSTLLQSLDILLKANTVEDIVISKLTREGFVEWTGNESINGKGGRLFYYDIDTIVYAIQPQINCCSKLKDAIKIYGEPSHVIILASQIFEEPNVGDWIYSYKIIWLEIGMEADGTPNIDGEINENFSISSVAYFEPSKDGLQKYEGRIADLMVNWKGYNNRSVYLVEK